MSYLKGLGPKKLSVKGCFSVITKLQKEVLSNSLSINTNTPLEYTISVTKSWIIVFLQKINPFNVSKRTTY